MRIRRFATIAATLFAAVIQTACIFKGGSSRVADIDLPPAGEPLPEESWNLAKEDQMHGGSSQLLWALPITIAARQWMFDPEAKHGHYEGFRWFDIGPLIVTLPVYISSQTRTYEREPATNSRESITWHPFWASASASGEAAAKPTRAASGVPLFWSRVRLDNERLGSEMRIATHLWTLGPLLVRLKVAPPPVESGAPQEEGRMYLFAPLALGGGPGLLLWTSYRTNSPGGYVTGHGPLVGVLGYSGSHTRMRMGADNDSWIRERSRQRLISGFLWYGSSEGPEGGRAKDARYGPLFGIFGWGRKNYAPCVQFLWFKIPVGKGMKDEG